MSNDEQQQDRAARAAERIAAIGIPKQELAQRAKIDRGTLGRLLKADPRIVERTWVKVERVLGQIEDELGMTAQLATTASGETAESVTSVVEYAGAKITLSGRADAVADAIRRVLDGQD